MGWRKVSTALDCVVLERESKEYITRIEARNEEDRWIVYNSFFNNEGLNLTEEFEAKTKEEADEIIGILQQQPAVTLESLKKQMLQRKKKVQLKIQRAYKEYNVEKWYFGINGGKHENFVTLRFYDDVEMDFVINEKFKPLEHKILKSIIATLGLKRIEEDLNINCYYFSWHTEKKIENAPKQPLFDKIEFGFDT